MDGLCADADGPGLFVRFRGTLCRCLVQSGSRRSQRVLRRSRLTDYQRRLPSAGRSVIAESASSVMTTFPGMQVIPDCLVIEADHIESHWTLVGTNTGWVAPESVSVAVDSQFGVLAWTG